MPKPVAPAQFICTGTSSADGKTISITECKPMKAAAKSGVKALGDCLGPVVSQQRAAAAGPTNSCQLGTRGLAFSYWPRLPDLGYYYVFADGNTITFYIDASGPSVSWSCTSVGVMSVAVLGNNGVDTVTPWGVYAYDGRVAADCGLLPGDPTAVVDGNATVAFVYDPQIAILNQVTVLEQTSFASAVVNSTCSWTPSISASPSTLNLACGASGAVNYTVTAAASPVLVDAALSSIFTLGNPTAFDITVDSVSASVTNGGTAYACSIDGAPSSLPAGAPAVNLTASVTFPSPTSTTIQLDLLVNLSITSDEGCQSTFVKYLSVEYTASVDASCTDAVLTYSLPAGITGSVALSGCQGTVVNQSVTLGPYADSGVHTESSSGALNSIGPGSGCPIQSVSSSVTVNVATCLVYCVRTQGYWTQRAPADKYDATWNLVGGPNAPFYLSNQTWIQVLNTSATSGTYYIAAPQFISARLNSLKAGLALPSAVQPAYDALEAAFSQYTPLQMSKLSKSAQSTIKSNAKILENFNYGNLTGYPACL